MRSGCPHLLDLSGFDAARVLAFWDWKLPASCELLAATRLGDLFLVTPDNRVLLLDLIDGALQEVAPSPAEFEYLASQAETADEWFLPGFVEALEGRGAILTSGQCYAFLVHPKLGGPLSSENLAPMDLVAYHVVCSALHAMPPGATVSGFMFDGKRP